MGSCISSTAMEPSSPATTTVKVVFPDGALREFEWPVMASQALGKDHSRNYFVCDADEMEIDGYVSAVDGDEELRRGQLYFVLPRSMLKSPIHGEEMAALAARASKALIGGRRRRGRGVVAPVEFEIGSAPEKKRVLKKGSGRGRKFSARLSAIPE
ncbi:uncharacterized protein LOC120267519 [Dioscorea cayenensis subsp. rotundata]|uniref:Uncharacterized protein LOC120267519 n=1 Tax=Dioscorea cayennensis subsp. rotundata TaxID=55577 RepID=A0AB40BXL7_DIOCR|nr:uncharacterized protein LOC120267519 [Dioscorea cayenensis subsp. rotundata]